MADLSRLDLAILEALIRYKTQPIIESLMDQIDRLMPHYIFSLRNPLLGGLLGVSMNTIRERVSPGAPLLRSGLVSFDSDNDLRLVKRLVRLGGATERADQDVTSLLLGDPVPSELKWSDFDHLGADRKHIRKIVQGALRSGASGVNILLYGPPGTGKTEFTKVLAARLGVNLFSIGESDDDGDEPSRMERLQELKMAHLLARDRKSILLFDEMEDLLAAEDESFALAMAAVLVLAGARQRGLEGIPEPGAGEFAGADDLDHERRPHGQSRDPAAHDVRAGAAPAARLGKRFDLAAPAWPARHRGVAGSRRRAGA